LPDQWTGPLLLDAAIELLYLNGKSTAALPLIERKERLRTLFKRQIRGLRFSDHCRQRSALSRAGLQDGR
jgi:ATP-dependent DNA ligase